MQTPKSKLTSLIAMWTLSVAILLSSGCKATVRPTIVKDSTPSFDGGQQNSGLIAFMADGRAIITEHARDRYNALIDSGYGTNFLPALKRDYGIQCCDTNGFYLMSPEALVKFGKMNRLRKSQ